jgi:hypothetical protein
MSDCRPPQNTKEGTLHILRDRSGREKQFLWLNSHWNTPGTGWGTKWSAMAALGWRYAKASDEAKGERTS